MQIKKMKDIGEQLYTTQVNGVPSSLTMSPKQPNSNRATRPDRHEAHTLLFQGSEAEASMMTFATCVQCKSVHRIPPQDLKKGPGQSQQTDRYICFKCSLPAAPAQFHFVTSNPSATHIGNEAKTIPSPVSSKFKVRNFKPGKLYCDKCRFSTKDPLQYRKHTLQHEEIRFICSHCSYVSYTKGEFQRHLVKHTGVFPYRCEYCDYGAIRNDYIVKHRKRVHERAGAKQPLKAVAKLEPKNTNVSKQSMEPLKAPAPRTAFQNKLSDQLSRFSLHTNKDKVHNIMLLPELEYQKDVVCIPNKMSLSEPNEMSLLGNKNVQVEVLSPTKEPVQPGMPLTVVAPAELVVPTNCLAQLINVKVVNGTQQLVLKLFPLEENTHLEPGRHNRGHETVTKEKGLEGQNRTHHTEPTKALLIEGSARQLMGLDHLHPAVQKQLKNMKLVKSCDFFMPNSGMHTHHESFLNSDAIKDLQKNHNLYPPRTLPSVALKGPSSGSVKNSVSRGSGTASNPFPCKAAAPFAEDGRNLHSESRQLLPIASSPATVSSVEKGFLPGGEGILECRSGIGIPENMLSSDRKLENKQGENKAVPKRGHVSSAHQNEYLHINLTEEKLRPQPSGNQLAQLKNSERTNDPFEGPVISSVFSLSSGSENVPEGVKWNSSTTKIKSIELLRRKIAQLIESCGKPSSLSASSAQRRSLGQAPKLTSKATPEGVQEINVALAGPGSSAGPLPNPQNKGGVTSNGQLAQQPICPPLTSGGGGGGGGGKAESRASRKSPVATPVLIPKGAVLRVLNSSEDARIIEATCDTPVSVPCSEAQLSEPVPFRPGEQTGSGSQPLTSQSGPADTAPGLETNLRPKSRKEDTVASVTPKKPAPVCGVQPGTNDLSKPGRLISRSPAISRSKAKQVSSAKKKSKIQADPSRCLKDPSVFQVARQLRLIAAKPDQLIKCPRRNQPVIVLNHPDVDSPEVSNVMKVINKYKGNVLKVVLSERTRCQLGIRRHHLRLTYQNMEDASHLKRQMMLKMKLKKVHKNNYQVVDTLPDDSAQCIFKCWFCGRLYEDQEEWMSHGQRHLIEATRDWDVLSSKGK